MSRIHKPTPISGFPEWLPEVRLAEQQMLDDIRGVFESYGFCSIATPLVERLEVLLAKGGDTDKEMYTLQRLQAEAGDRDARFGVRYDLTIPLARYVAQHFGSLTFPFKRYQMQPICRGERPQDGRFREFTQCDVDVVADGELAPGFDAELPAIAWDALRAMGLEDLVFRISNRKILEGFLRGAGVEDAVPVIRQLDKLDKIGPEAVTRGLAEECGVAEATATLCLEIASIRTHDLSFVEEVRALGIENELLDTGLQELADVITAIRDLTGERMPEKALVADLSIARGFDYYTGTVYEVRWDEFPGVGTISAGGRYDNLAANFTRKKLPGVGISIGFTRIFAKLVAEGRIHTARKTPADVLVTWLDEDEAARPRLIARQLRERGIRVETYHRPARLKKQLEYANRKGIPYLWLDADGAVKDMATGEQSEADSGTWQPTRPKQHEPA